jgi:chromosome segregation ATPase
MIVQNNIVIYCEGQIDALETVKELSSELHEKYSLLSKEKNNLENEKNQLIEIAEELQIKLEEKTEHEKQLLDYSVELENELKDLKKMYDDMLLSLEHMEKIGNNEKMIRINCETKIKDYEDIIHPLKSEVLLLRQKLGDDYIVYDRMRS